MFSYNWITERIKNLLEPYDITMQQYNVLRILRGSHPEPLSTLEIRHRMLDKMSDVSRIVDRMLAKGLVTKKPCPNDKRLVDVLISNTGMELLTKMDTIEDLMDGQMSNLDPVEAAELNRLLDKMRG